ncbi:MAG: non-canonical purine NTP pyrophosphatase [Gemmatimonadaceae bacterium]|jgi:XTP/dITP diphosphohydrolase|nr:non-canonical purine NTP pyrophosphatase [Gemmatimonadaceae bacterium]
MVRATVVLATRSAGKQRELRALLEDAGWGWCLLEDLGLLEDDASEAAIECFDTFAENALAKARWFAALAPGRWVLAEDSGLCVDALGGAPGVQSKRWGGVATETGAALDAANIARLQAALAAVGAEQPEARSAAYVCAAVLISPEGKVMTAEGRTAGRILRHAAGREGFGYDPVFYSTELSGSFGVLPASAKGSVSHRARAVRAVLSVAAKNFGETG